MLALLLLNRMNAKRRARTQKPVKVDRIQRKVSDNILHCRTCLSTVDLVSIFYNKETESKRSHDLRLVTGLEIKMNDGLSQKICTRCIESMNKALQFRRTSKKSEKAMLNMLSGKAKKRPRLQKTLKPKMEGVKVTKVEVQDFSYDGFGDQFQDQDDGEGDGDDLKETKLMPPPKKKRVMIPNSASYKCATCNKEFRMKATYKAHMRFHTNYCVCEACGKRCRNNNQLQEHKRARHGLYRIHKCAYCEYSSATKEALTIHERRHTGERPYVCDHCGATFHRRSNLVQHIAIHLPEKNFQCSICNKREKSKKRLQVHEYKVHREHRYRYTCPRCPKTYKCPDHVRRHLINAHGIPRSQQGPVHKYIPNTTQGPEQLTVNSAV